MKIMLAILLIQARFIPSPCLAQAVQLEAVFAAAPTIDLGPGSTVTAGIVLPGQHGELRTKANAVVVGPGYALTSAHCVRKSGKRLLELLVAQHPASVVLVSDNLALLSIQRDRALPVAVIRKGWDPASPAVGERLVHVYFSHTKMRTAQRLVTWNGLSSINEGFREGMSGSGLYALDGSLVGIAEWTTGYAEGALSIAAFASQTAQLGLRCLESQPAAREVERL